MIVSKTSLYELILDTLAV